MTVRSSSKRIQTLLGPFYAVLFAIIVFKKYQPTYLISVSRGGQLKTGLKLVVRVACGSPIVMVAVRNVKYSTYVAVPK